MSGSEPGQTLTGLRGRVALVTGSGANMGRAILLALAGAGANVAVNVRQNEAQGKEVAEAAGDLGVEAITVVGDISDPAVAEELLRDVERRLGPVDILVHCVGIRPWLRVGDTSVDTWHEVMDTNCSSFFYLARSVLPSMAERGFGRLIVIGGPDANRAVPNHGSVSASKAALVALTKVIATEYGSAGVTANIVSPTITETTAPEHRSAERLQELLPIPRAGRLDEIAFACLYLASEQASYVTGLTLRVDGGFEV